VHEHPPPPPWVGQFKFEFNIPSGGLTACPWGGGRSDRELLVEPPPPLPPVVPGEPLMRFTHQAYLAVMRALGTVNPEAGGILLGPRDSDLVTHFHRDENGVGTPMTFTIDAKGMNAALKVYKEARLEMKGVVHSHPPRVKSPSGPDLEYAAQLMQNPKNEAADDLLMPIYCGGTLYPYIVYRDEPGVGHRAQLVLV
jgi:proteasome lid subunit RPN8/RPN11